MTIPTNTGRLLLFTASVALWSCSGPSVSDTPKAGGGMPGLSGGVGGAAGLGTAGVSPTSGGGDSDPEPVISAEARAQLLALSPSATPAAPPLDATNAFADDPRAAAFGQKLFFETSFSGPLLDTDNDGSPGALGKPGDTGKVACASCHLPEGGFSDTRSFQLQISLGAGWGRRRAPSLLDVGQARLLMWDGRHDTLYNQPFGPIESVVEMNSSRLYAAEQVFRKHRGDYEAIFGAMPALDDPEQFPQLDASQTGCQPKYPSSPAPACDGTFHGMPGDNAEYDGMTAENQVAVTRVVVNIGKALGAYERLLSCGATPFDEWMHGGKPISSAAQRGAALFVGRAGCASCHSGPFLSDQKFHNVGLEPKLVQQGFTDSNDQGAAIGLSKSLADSLNSRGAFSDGDDGRLPAEVPPNMLGAFRTPTLRCVSQRPTFMHTGQLETLADTIKFFNSGGSYTGYPGTNELLALGLSPLEQSDLVAFLTSLNGPGADARYRQAP